MKCHDQVRPYNPNKWSKHLAPWFTEECRQCKVDYKSAVKLHGRASDIAKEAYKKFRHACIEGKI